MADPWRNRIVGSGEENPEQLLANPHNWRIHPRSQQEGLAGVLDDIGWVQRVIVNQRTGHTIDGHLRVTLAMRRDEPTIPVDYVDLSEEEELIILATLDPLAGLAATDKDKLKELLDSVKTDNAHVKAMLEGIALKEGIDRNGDGVVDPGAEMDKADVLQEKWQVKRGDVWEIPSKSVEGKAHRVMCGDSTCAEDVGRLMGGEKAQAVVTDPPYGQSWLSNYYGPTRSAPNPQGKLIGDDKPRPELLTQWVSILDHDAALYVCTRWTLCDVWCKWISAQLKIKNIIIWAKNNWSAGDLKGAYGFMYEQIIFAVKGNHELRGSRLPDVWQFDRVPPTQHPTQKPVELFSRCIEKSTNFGTVIADGFLGSGTTIVAAEQTGRIGFGMEIAEKYVAVILHRLEGMNLDPRRIPGA